MKQEDKELLLKDLCARLPYGVKGLVTFNGNHFTDEDRTIDGKLYDRFAEFQDSWYDNVTIKPYLFPLSSMTEEQKEELDKYFDIDSKSLIDGYKNGLRCPHPYFNVQDWYNKNHFDYRGFIPMGLAIDATNKNVY